MTHDTRKHHHESGSPRCKQVVRDVYLHVALVLKLCSSDFPKSSLLVVDIVFGCYQLGEGNVLQWEERSTMVWAKCSLFQVLELSGPHGDLYPSYSPYRALYAL